MNTHLYSLCTPCPEGFSFCSEFHLRDFRAAPFALYSPSLEAARSFLGEHLGRLDGIILVAGERLSWEAVTPQLSAITVSPSMQYYLADFATHQLGQIDNLVSSREQTSLLSLENKRLVVNNERSAEEFSQFRASLLREIEERRNAERRLAESEERLSLIMASSGDAIYGIDMNGRCTFANESCLKTLGYSHIGELLGQNMHDLIHHGMPDGTPIPVEECLIFKTFRDGIGVTNSDEYFWRSDGSCFPVEYSSYPIHKNGVIIGSVITWRDITERKNMERALLETREMFTLFMKYSPIYTFIKQIEGEQSRVLQLSDNFIDMVGIPADEMRGRTMQEVFPEEFAQKITADDIAVLKEGNVLQLNEDFNGRNYTTIKFPILREGKDNLLAGFTIDVTDRRRAEEERLDIEKRLLHTQKLESLGVLAGGVAHDFNNLLMAIMGNADLALMRLKPESPAVSNLHNIEKAAARAADLAKQMLAYSGKGKFVVESLDLNHLLEEMLHMLEVSISKKAVLRLNPYPQLPPVEADATQMRQIIMNLVINASEAIGDKSGVIAITTGCMDCDRSYLKDVWLDENITDGLYVYLEIADSGCGMDSETLAKIFDPFFTTKFTGRGLGMAAVLGIIRGHKGAIKVYSEINKGTTFKILLPASSRPVELFNGHSGKENWKGTGTVLLVDDEETVRGIGAEMLRELGFTVITANDGKEALECFKQTPDISFVILDLTMPRMDGEQCFRELRQLKPDVKVIISSGYNEQEVTQKFAGKKLAGFIQKPYKLSVLMDAVRALQL